MNVTEIVKKIYSGPFSHYLHLSEGLGNPIQEQSKLVNSLFKLHINIVQIWQKYKKPWHQEQEDIFTEPIAKQISLVEKFTAEHESENGYLQFISEFVDIFWWMKHPEVETFLNNINNKVTLYRLQLKRGKLCSDAIYSSWLEAWFETVQEFSNFISSNFQNSVLWTGSEKLPVQTVLGDIPSSSRNFNHSALLKEINHEENITRVLRNRNDDGASVSSATNEL